MKNFNTVIFAIFFSLLFISFEAEAQFDDADEEKTGSANANEWRYQESEEDNLWYKLCQFRHAFCGRTATALVAVVVLTVGVLVLIGKIQWCNIIIVAAGVIIFTGAEKLAAIIDNTPFDRNIEGHYLQDSPCYCDTVLGGPSDGGSSSSNGGSSSSGSEEPCDENGQIDGNWC